MSENSSDRNPIDVLAEEFAARCRQGETPSVEEYAAKYPQWAGDIRALFPPVALMEELKRRRQAGRAVAPPQIEQLGDFRIVREIGRGGMGIVYEAHQLSLDRRVALKVLPRYSLLDDVHLQRFQREARAAAQLHHTNIVPVFGVGEQDGLHYYVMQFIEGKSLSEILNSFRKIANQETTGIVIHSAVPFPNSGSAYWRWAAQVGVQIAEAIQYAHKQGTLHRDIKPANVILDLRGTAWITDFGLAKIINDPSLTETGDLIGTLQYMAPECFQSKADERADVYSTGLTLYELLTLRPPFAESTAMNLIREMGDRDPVPPRRINPAIPRDLENIVMKASARDPGQRYQSASALADDLRRFMDDQPVLARPPAPSERLLRWCRRNRTVAALTAAAIASLLLALVAGWVGYVKTNDALGRESQRLAEADLAKKRAEDNVRMSLQAFEDIFNELEPQDGPASREPRPFENEPPPDRRRFDGERPPPGPQGPPRQEPTENIAVVQSILNFYERFAAQNETNSNLHFEAAKAYGRVGDIQRRLGQREKAEASLRHALDMAAKLHEYYPHDSDYTVLAAQLYSRLAAILQTQVTLDEADEYHRKAIALLGTLLKQFPAQPRYVIEYSRARLNYAEFLLLQKNHAGARALLEASIQDIQPYADEDASNRPLLSRHFDLLSEVYRGLGLSDAALEALNEAERVNPRRPRGRPPSNDRRPPPYEPREPRDGFERREWRERPPPDEHRPYF